MGKKKGNLSHTIYSLRTTEIKIWGLKKRQQSWGELPSCRNRRCFWADVSKISVPGSGCWRPNWTGHKNKGCAGKWGGLTGMGWRISWRYHGISWDFLQLTPNSFNLGSFLGCEYGTGWVKGACRINLCVKQLLFRHLQNILGSLSQGDNRIAWELSVLPAGVKKTIRGLLLFSCRLYSRKWEGNWVLYLPQGAPSCLSSVSGQKPSLR